MSGAADTDLEEMCLRCGSTAAWEDCTNCGSDGFSHHDCGEDVCCCAYPEDDVMCDWCDGKGGYWLCMSDGAWCHAHPLPGRETVPRGKTESG